MQTDCSGRSHVFVCCLCRPPTCCVNAGWQPSSSNGTDCASRGRWTAALGCSKALLAMRPLHVFANVPCSFLLAVVLLQHPPLRSCTTAAHGAPRLAPAAAAAGWLLCQGRARPPQHRQLPPPRTPLPALRRSCATPSARNAFCPPMTRPARCRRHARKATRQCVRRTPPWRWRRRPCWQLAKVRYAALLAARPCTNAAAAFVPPCIRSAASKHGCS